MTPRPLTPSHVDQFWALYLKHVFICLLLLSCSSLSPRPTMHSVPGDASVRCEQLDLLLQWGAEFRQASSQPPEGEKVLEDLVAFDVVLGDLNFDNCSSGEQTSWLNHYMLYFTLCFVLFDAD